MGFGDYDFSMHMRDLMTRIATETINKTRPKYHYGTVTSIDRDARKCGVTLNGDSAPVLVNMGSIQPAVVGQVVRVDGIGTDKFISDVMGPSVSSQFVSTTRAQQQFQGGGRRRVTSNSIHWSDRFIPIAFDKSKTFAPSGYFSIYAPPPGTQIEYQNQSATPEEVRSNGDIPMGIWTTLWYELPVGKGHTTIPGNFRLTQHYTADNWSVPANWVRICSRTATAGSPAYQWGDGLTQDFWRNLSLRSPWSRYSDTYETGQWRNYGADQVELRGLVKGGSLNQVISSVPDYATPRVNKIAATMSSDQPSRLTVYSGSGEIVPHAGTVTGGWVSLDGVRYSID